MLGANQIKAFYLEVLLVTVLLILPIRAQHTKPIPLAQTFVSNGSDFNLTPYWKLHRLIEFHSKESCTSYRSTSLAGRSDVFASLHCNPGPCTRTGKSR